MSEIGIYTNTGKRVQFDEAVFQTPKRNQKTEGRTLVKTITAPVSTPARAVSPSPQRRSWSPLRRSRKKALQQQQQETVPSSTTNNSSSANRRKSASPHRQRRGWFGQRSPPSPKKQRQRSGAAAAVEDEAACLTRETEKLVRTLAPSAVVQPLRSEAVAQAFLAVLDLQEHQHGKGDESRIAQLQKELKAAQKAASQLASKNLMYEEQQETLLKELEHARERLEELEKAQQSAKDDDGNFSTELATELQSLKEQLNKTKSAMMELQAENVDLKKAAEKSKAADEFLSENPIAGVDDSFELQLSLQKDLAQVTAKVHALEAENKNYAEKQQKMEEVIKMVESLEEENAKLTKENTTLKEQLAHSQAEMTRALITAKSAPSHKDMVLSSSQLATATTIIGRLTEECKTLTQREKELSEKLERLETKNKNQKEIFHTALEIKQVEMRIYEQEAKMNARKVEELNKAMADLHHQQGSIVASSPATDDDDSEAVAVLRGRLNDTGSRLHKAESSNQDLEDRVNALQQELEERKARVSQLEELLRTETEAVKREMEQETADLSRQVIELSSLIKYKEDELQKIHDELEDERKESEYRTQVRVNELTEQLNDYEMSIEEREKRIHELQEKLNEQGLIIAKNKASSSSFDEDDASSQHSSKLDAIRRKMGTYENLMRAKMNRIQEIDHTNSAESQEHVSGPMSASSSREESPPPMMVVATPVPETRVIEMEASLKASDEQIEELRAQLADAQLRLAQVQEAHDQASGYAEMEASLKRSEDRIMDLKEKLRMAHCRLGETTQSGEVQQKEAKVQAALIPAKEGEGGDKLNETERALAKSTAEITHLRTLLQKTEAELEELHNGQADLSRDESTESSTRDQAAMDALEEELEAIRQRYDDECDMRQSLVVKLEQLAKEHDDALEKLQQAEFKLLERQNNMEELVNALDQTKEVLDEMQKQALAKSSVPEGRLAELEDELIDAREQIAEADMKIEMLERFIEEETATSAGSSVSKVNYGSSSMQAEADIKRKDEEMQLLRSDVERTRKELLRSRERIENLEMERNYSTAKLKELSSIVKTKAGSEAEVQLYNKCIECAELSADKDDLSNKLRSSEARVRRLEQEIKATQQMVNDISQSWDTAASADENVSRLKREHGESVSRATTLSIELAESQMQIDKLADKLASAERANKTYAEELNGRPGIFRVIAGSRSSSRQNSRHSSPERRDENIEIRKLKQRIALLEDQNAAYEASLTAFSSLHEPTRMAM
uniref:Uncharacterized protein n=1 Tax=Amphora coffeiformis TaxID=265554 RepID=A0A7S3KWU9_9STRA